MGSFLWIIRQVIHCPDGWAVGEMKRHKRFAPFPDLWLVNMAIYRDAETDGAGRCIHQVSCVDSPREASLDFFRVDLTEQILLVTLHEATALYGPDFVWTFHRNEEPTA